VGARGGRFPSRLWHLALLVAVTACLAADEPPAPAPAPAAPAATKPPAEPIDRLPYRIKAIFIVEPETRLDVRRRDGLVGDWLSLVRRFVGAPWSIEVSPESPVGPLAGDLDALSPEAFASESTGFDKVWLIRVSRHGSGLSFAGREFDVAVVRLGPPHRRSAPVARDAPRVLLHFTLELFSAYAEINERFAKSATLTVRGASLAPASPIGRVVAEGTIFQPLRIVPQKSGKPIVREIPFTFLRVESAEGAHAKCSFVSVFPDPLTRQFTQKIALVALGVKPGKSPIRLRFLTRPDRVPAAGYVLTAKLYPDGIPHEVGTTDREGRITLDPSVADGLVVLRLLAGSSEPLIEFPLMPGDNDVEHVITEIDPKPLAVALETQLDSLRDRVIDLVAVRARLEARLKARNDGEDWAGAEEALKEFRALTPRETIAGELTRLKEQAARQQAKSKTAVLTRTAQAQLTDLQSLIDRYLEDDVFKGYADALERLKSGPPAKPQRKPPL
jgi:hypothetical protein